jgi:Tfp pilus assembly protein FimV
MKPAAGQVVRRQPVRWPWARILALAAGLFLIEWQLLAVMGTPAAQLRVLRDLGLSPTDPVTPLLAVLALLTEALIGYVVVVLALRTLSLLPGSIGGLTGRAVLHVSPDAVRKVLDVLVGGTLLAQATLTAMPSAPPDRPLDAVNMTTAASVTSIGAVGLIGPTGPATGMGPATTWPTTTRPAETRPPSRRLAAPLPPWLGGGPSKPKVGYTVVPGDTLWDIAAARLQPTERSSARVHRYWQQIYRANRPAIGDEPDLIHPGTRLHVPRFRSERR